MATGGNVNVVWNRADAATVTITGPGTMTPTSPQTITASQNFTTTVDGDYTVTVTAFGRTLASFVTTISNGAGRVFNPEPSISLLEDELAPATATTAQLASIAATINTLGKYTGKVVYNTTTSKPVWAVGGTAGSVWNDATATLAHTPV